MRAQQRQPGQHQVAATGANHHGDEAELAHGAERQDQLQVVFAHRAPAREDDGQHAERDHHRPPRRRVGEAGSHPRDEVDAGLDHRGGVQVGADRRRGGHRAGQPEVQRNDRRLGQCANEYQHDPDRSRKAVRRRRDQFGQQICARDGAEHDDAYQHGESACRGDQQRLHCGLAAADTLGVMTHQKKGQHGGELPEHVEHQHVVADHQPEHGACERDQLRGEAGQPFLGVAVMMVEVVGAVEQHQRADAEHQHTHDRRECVEPQGDVHRQFGQPRHVDAEGLAPTRPVQHNPAEGGERDEGQRIERLPSPSVHQQGGQRSGNRVGEKNGEQGTPIVCLGRR